MKGALFFGGILCALQVAAQNTRAGNSSIGAEVSTPGFAAKAQSPAKGGLKLKMISGTPQRRLATINDETFFSGETHVVTVDARRVNVQCVAIDETSATVRVEGESVPRQLVLGQINVEPIVILEGPAAGRQEARYPGDPEFQMRYERFKLVGLAILGAMLAAYVPFCFSCFRLCRRAGTPSYFLIWLPWLKRIPLFQITGVWLVWFFLSIFVPFVGFIAWVVCCYRLCGLFNRSKAWTLMMIWPLIGWPVFLYLDHASKSDDDEPAVQALRSGYANF